MTIPDDFEDDAGVDENGLDAGDMRPSRTQQTRAATAVNHLGLELSRLSSSQLDRLELPERLREEIEVGQRLKPRSRGRQNRLIGQLLRAEDHDAIRSRLEALNAAGQGGVREEKIVEHWLTRLVEEGDPAIEALIKEHPQADRQRLRVLARSARQGTQSKKVKRARRELLRAIRELRGTDIPRDLA